MPDLGAIGRSQHVQTRGSQILQGGPYTSPMGVWIEPGAIQRMWSEGNPAAPAQIQYRGVLKGIVWPFAAGTRTLTIRVRHSGHEPRPRLVVKANPEAGVPADVEAVPTASLAWQDVSVTVVTSQSGAVEVWREVRAVEQGAYAIWDHLRVT